MIKVWEKSRRIGATYAQSYEDVFDMLNARYPAVWFSSADESAAKEYMRYCRQWAEIFCLARPDIKFLETKDASGLLRITFSNGKRITALTSNPKGFRSKGGKVVLDEFAHHDQDTEMWKAAKPATAWGYPIRILSTHNGKQCLFYRFIEEIQSGKLPWKLHKTTIYDAVQQKLVDAMQGKRVSKETRNEWLEELRKNCFDDTVWNEEFCCIPVDEVTAFLSYDLIRSCEDETLSVDGAIEGCKELFMGIDIGRKNDLTVLFIIERVGDVYRTRQIKTMHNSKFDDQKKVIFDIIKRGSLLRGCIDGTGIGMNIAEDCYEEFGSEKIDVITFNPAKKEQMAYLLRRNLENQTLIIPSDPTLRDDLHSIKKMITNFGNTRFDAAHAQTGSHADRFWAAALALMAADSVRLPSLPVSRNSKPRSRAVKGYT